MLNANEERATSSASASAADPMIVEAAVGLGDGEEVAAVAATEEPASAPPEEVTGVAANEEPKDAVIFLKPASAVWVISALVSELAEVAALASIAAQFQALRLFVSLGCARATSSILISLWW